MFGYALKRCGNAAQICEVNLEKISRFMHGMRTDFTVKSFQRSLIRNVEEIHKVSL
jgi:hypothetical protein